MLVAEPLEAQLAQEGYAVHTAYYGVAGLPDQVRKRRFDAVIADDHMPGFTGREFAKFCRITWPDTPLILLIRDRNSLTNYADDPVRQPAFVHPMKWPCS